MYQYRRVSGIARALPLLVLCTLLLLVWASSLAQAEADPQDQEGQPLEEEKGEASDQGVKPYEEYKVVPTKRGKTSKDIRDQPDGTVGNPEDEVALLMHRRSPPSRANGLALWGGCLFYIVMLYFVGTYCYTRYRDGRLSAAWVALGVNGAAAYDSMREGSDAGVAGTSGSAQTPGTKKKASFTARGQHTVWVVGRAIRRWIPFLNPSQNSQAQGGPPQPQQQRVRSMRSPSPKASPPPEWARDARGLV